MGTTRPPRGQPADPPPGRGRPTRREPTAARSRQIRRRRVVAALLGAALLGTGAWTMRGQGLPSACSVRLPEGERDLSRAEAMTATTVAAVGIRDGRSETSVAAALGAALDHHDDSLGPDAAARLYDDGGEPTDDTQALARVLLGHDGAALTCRGNPLSGAERQDEDSGGLTPRARTALGAVEAAFGDRQVGGFDVGGVDSGHMSGSAHYDGRAVDVFYRPVDDANRAHGWSTAQWLVAHAERLELATVIYDGQVWSRGRSLQGWREYTPPGGPTDDPVLRHLDHVHLDVVEGS